MMALKGRDLFRVKHMDLLSPSPSLSTAKHIETCLKEKDKGYYMLQFFYI